MKKKQILLAAIATLALWLGGGAAAGAATTENTLPLGMYEPTMKGGPEKMVFAASSEGYVNIRQKPTTKSILLGRLTNGGAGATYLRTVGEWYEIDCGGTKGYVKSEYATVRSADEEVTGVYYVVIGSETTLERAKKALETLPDFFICPIYKAVIGGTPRYRICESCFSTQEKAEARIKDIKAMIGRDDLWVWSTNEPATCVFCPVGPSGDPVTPLRVE